MSMDREDKRTAEIARPTLPENDHRHRRHLKPQQNKLLTLPTILTIARVAAVPILISSTLSIQLVFINFYTCI